MKTLNCLIIDDDEIYRLTLTSFAKQHPRLNIVAVLKTAVDAIKFIENNDIDILFLDIDMPLINGIEFRKKALDVPICIFITSHPDYAIESFELDTLDYIIKPIKFERFNQTMQKIYDYIELLQKAKLFELTIGGDTIFIKEGYKEIKIKLHEILYLEALKDYTTIVTSEKKYHIISNLGTVLKQPNFLCFIRIHRSFAVQKHFIKTICANEIVLNNEAILPIGRSFKDNLNF